MATVKFKKVDPAAKLPTYGNSKDSGMDIYALEPFEVRPGYVTKVRTGIAVQLPEGYEGQVRPRSGNASKLGITVLNAPGTIDEGYRGEIIVLLVKHTDLSNPPFPAGVYKGEAGDRVAQLVVKEIEYHDIVEIEEFDAPDTERGASGFGSTGR